MLTFAQGSGGGGAVGASPTTGGGVGSLSAFDTTKTIKLTVVAVQQDGTLLVKDEKGTTVVAKLDKKVTFRAEKGTELAGQKHIRINDLMPGMLVKATYRTTDLVVVELRILKAKEQKSIA